MIAGEIESQHDHLLVRVDRTKNMARFYTLMIEPTLFGDVSLVRRWGRIGTAGRQRIELYAGLTDAVSALTKKVEQKKRRGYLLTK
jgi:predicted DNA-binding WGR domain protein